MAATATHPGSTPWHSGDPLTLAFARRYGSTPASPADDQNSSRGSIRGRVIETPAVITEQRQCGSVRGAGVGPPGMGRWPNSNQSLQNSGQVVPRRTASEGRVYSLGLVKGFAEFVVVPAEGLYLLLEALEGEV